jgi:trehalose 6-phosphate synthase
MIRPYPISIEWPPSALATQAPVPECRAAVARRLGLRPDARIVVGIERFDYTKGILDRMQAIDHLLRRRPSWRGRLVFVQAAAPTRSKLSAYGTLQKEAERLAEEINARHGDGGYTPIVLVARHHEPGEVYELFRAADACIVSSLHDGMNLVAKEFVAARDDEQGVLILSTFAGASRELNEALLVNPYDAQGMAEALERALVMPEAEQRERMRLGRPDAARRSTPAQPAADRGREHRRGSQLNPASPCPLRRGPTQRACDRPALGHDARDLPRAGASATRRSALLVCAVVRRGSFRGNAR